MCVSYSIQNRLVAKVTLAFGIMMLGQVEMMACNIPVFRYALERWQPDNCELIVFHHGALNQQQQESLTRLQEEQKGRGEEQGGKLTMCDLSTPEPAHRLLWDSIRTQADPAGGQPYVVVRMNLGKGRTVNGWHGTLSDAVRIGIMNSPARRELSKRLLAGHSVIWLVIKAGESGEGSSGIKKINLEARRLLEENFSWLTKNIALPEGIGLPGSELHSEIPLLLKFTRLEIERNDPEESFLVSLFSGIQPEAFERGEDLIIPVFGRGRALEVIPASVLTTPLIKDLTVFLSGACSCQVKERNPGFDLLMSVDWNTRLFGEGNAPPPVRTERDRLNRKPELLTIPPGK